MNMPHNTRKTNPETKNTSMLAKTNESRNSKTGYLETGNPATIAQGARNETKKNSKDRGDF